MADTRSMLILIEVRTLTVTDGDWEGIETPLQIRRNLTMRGGPALSSWPVLSLAMKHKVQLMEGATLRAEECILVNARVVDNFWRAPGIDALAASPAGTVAAGFVGANIAVMADACFPEALDIQNVLAAVRPPGVPGAQNYSFGVAQPSCVNSTSAPLLSRCWPYITRIHDSIMDGADPDNTGGTTPNHYRVQLLNVSLVCTLVLKIECIFSLGPIGCLILTQREAAAAAAAAEAAAQPPLMPSYVGQPPQAPAGVAAVVGAHQEPAGSGSGAPARGYAGVIAGSVVGGAVLLLLIALVAIMAIRHRWQRLLDVQSNFSAVYDMPPPKSALSRVDEEKASCRSTPPGPHQNLSPLRMPSSTWGPKRSFDEVITPRTPIRPDILVGEAAAANDDCLRHDDLGGSIGAGPTDDSGRISGSAAHASQASAASREDVVTLLPTVLGKGAFGRVYEGTYRGQRVAVKQMLEPFEGTVDLEKQQAAFAQELEVLGRCEHPNILRVLAACVTPPRPCLVMELMDTSLDKLLYGTEQLLPLPLVLHIASEIAHGLAYLHPTVLHRDLKPANVLINDPWGELPVVKLADFGLSRLRSTVLLTRHPDAGTECFTMEVGASETTYKADMYSFGVVLWEMLAGCRPWMGLGAVPIACQVALMGRRLAVPPQNVPGNSPSRWPPRLCELLEECWDKDPERRPAAAELAERLLLVKQRLPTTE